jgi:hypothetical protein
VKVLATPYMALSVPDGLRNNPGIYAEEVLRFERFGIESAGGNMPEAILCSLGCGHTKNTKQGPTIESILFQLV